MSEPGWRGTAGGGVASILCCWYKTQVDCRNGQTGGEANWPGLKHWQKDSGVLGTVWG